MLVFDEIYYQFFWSFIVNFFYFLFSFYIYTHYTITIPWYFSLYAPRVQGMDSYLVNECTIHDTLIVIFLCILYIYLNMQMNSYKRPNQWDKKSLMNKTNSFGLFQLYCMLDHSCKQTKYWIMINISYIIKI